MLFAIVLLLTIGCIAFALVREAQRGPSPGGLRGRIRDRGWGLLLLPVAMAAAVMAGGAHGLVPAELGLAALAIVFAPELAAKLVPYGVLGLAVFGVHLARKYNDGNTSQVQALLLIPVVGLTMQLLGPGDWLGWQAVDGLDVVVMDLTLLAGALVLIFRSRAWAATLAAAGLLVLGAYGWGIAAFWPAVPGFGYGFCDLHNSPTPGPFWGVGLEASILLAAGLWLAPRVTRHHLDGSPDPELAARARQLTQRVQTLTQTRHDAVDTAAAELRRIERDLHDRHRARRGGTSPGDV